MVALTAAARSVTPNNVRVSFRIVYKINQTNSTFFMKAIFFTLTLPGLLVAVAMKIEFSVYSVTYLGLPLNLFVFSSVLGYMGQYLTDSVSTSDLTQHL